MKYEVAGANKHTGDVIHLIIEAATFRDAERKANDLGVVVSDVREHHEQVLVKKEVVAEKPQGLPRRKNPYQCKLCEQGTLRLTKLYRMSPMVVLIGYVILVPFAIITAAIVVLYILMVVAATQESSGSGLVGVTAATPLMIIAFIFSLPATLLGWLLVMRKKVLQCSVCQAVNAAS